MHRFAIALLLLLSLSAAAAPVPELDEARPLVCDEVSTTGDWTPTVDEIQLLEKAIPPYFRALKLKSSELPAAGHRYARQYTGITRDGRKYIYGRFYPMTDTLASQAKTGKCWNVSDGGNLNWSLVFDPKIKSIVSFAVNGVA